MSIPLSLRSRRVALGLVAGALLAPIATACEPAEPGVFTVAPLAVGADADPGDGICATAAAACSLQAAVEEANALDTPTTITFASFDAVPELDLTVTGRIELLGLSPVVAPIMAAVSWTVAAGAELAVTDAFVGPVVVDGTFSARRVWLGHQGDVVLDPVAALVQVGPTGSALLANVYADTRVTPLLDNDGVVSIHATSIDAQRATGAAAITTGAGGQTRLSATAFLSGTGGVAECGGTAPVSYGYNLAPDTSCGLTMTGDRQDFDRPELTPLAEGDVRVDAIPLGTLHCGAGWKDDLYSGSFSARPVDSDMNGTEACEIGARELGLGA